MITSAVNTGSTFPGLYMVEAWGRRPLLLFGAIGMATCQFIVAGVGTGIGTANEIGQKALISFVCIYIFFFACSWGPCAWVVTGEIVSGLLCPWDNGGAMTDSSAVPVESPCQGALDDDRFELAAELGHRLRYPVSCRRRTRQRQLAIEGLLHLGRVS